MHSDRLLFNADLQQNQLTVVTFNFGRSFERALSKLGGSLFAGRELLGTAYGMPSGPRFPALREFGGALQMKDGDTLTFLQNSGVIDE